MKRYWRCEESSLILDVRDKRKQSNNLSSVSGLNLLCSLICAKSHTVRQNFIGHILWSPWWCISNPLCSRCGWTFSQRMTKWTRWRQRTAVDFKQSQIACERQALLFWKFLYCYCFFVFFSLGSLLLYHVLSLTAAWAKRYHCCFQPKSNQIDTKVISLTTQHSLKSCGL